MENYRSDPNGTWPYEYGGRAPGGYRGRSDGGRRGRGGGRYQGQSRGSGGRYHVHSPRCVRGRGAGGRYNHSTGSGSRMPVGHATVHTQNSRTGYSNPVYSNSNNATGSSAPARPKHAQRAVFDEYLKFMHPGIETSASALKFLAALQDQIAFKGVKEVVWRLAKPAVAAEIHSTAGPASHGQSQLRDQGHLGAALQGRASAADVMEDKAPGLKRVEELLRCAASNEASGVVQMVLPLLEALLGKEEGSTQSDRAMVDVLAEVRSPCCLCFPTCLACCNRFIWSLWIGSKTGST